jgi:hypothetical protein
LTRAIQEGIREAAPDPSTAHGAPEMAALDYWEVRDGIQVNNVYTYEPVHAPALAPGPSACRSF